MTINESIKWGAVQLEESCERPLYESELLLAYHLKKDRMFLITHASDKIEELEWV